MKLLVLLLVTVFVTNANADIFQTLDGIRDGVEHTKNSLKFVIKNTLDTGITAVKDTFHEAFDFSKVPPRVLVPDLIRNAGYQVESHYVTTRDGYILNIHRIPNGKVNRKKKNEVVYLQHGIMCASSDWVLFGPKRGLAYILADEGYDVWMGNVRGSFYSRNHTVLYPDTDAEYWQFSWHEMGIFDIPTMIDYILKKTEKQSLYYVGHSQGNTAFYVMASEKPEYNKKIKAQISLSPVAFVKNTVSPVLKMLARANGPLGNLMERAGLNEFLPNTGLLHSLSHTICGEGIGKVLCKNALFVVVGFSPKQLTVSDVSLLLAHYPAGAATKQIIHYQQETISGRFCKFDFGRAKNNIIYKQIYPPAYDLSKISTPVVLIYSHNDWLTHKLDVDRLSRELGNLKEQYLVSVPSWNHLDFLFGVDAPTVIYERVVELLAKY